MSIASRMEHNHNSHNAEGHDGDVDKGFNASIQTPNKSDHSSQDPRPEGEVALGVDSTSYQAATGSQSNALSFGPKIRPISSVSNWIESSDRPSDTSESQGVSQGQPFDRDPAIVSPGVDASRQHMPSKSLSNANAETQVQFGPEIQRAADTLVGLSQVGTGSPSFDRDADNSSSTHTGQRGDSREDSVRHTVNPRCRRRSLDVAINLSSGTESEPLLKRPRTQSYADLGLFGNYDQGSFSLEPLQRRYDAQRHLRNARARAPYNKGKTIKWPSPTLPAKSLVHERKFEPASSGRETLMEIFYGERRRSGQEVMRRILYDLLGQDEAALGYDRSMSKGKGKQKRKATLDEEITVDPRLSEHLKGRGPASFGLQTNARRESSWNVEEKVLDDEEPGSDDEDQQMLIDLEDEDEFPEDDDTATSNE